MVKITWPHPLKIDRTIWAVWDIDDMQRRNLEDNDIEKWQLL